MRDVFSDFAKIRREAEEKEARETAERTGLGYTVLDTLAIQPETLLIIPQEIARAEQMICFKKVGKNLSVAVWNPGSETADMFLLGLRAKGYEIEKSIASRSSIANSLVLYEKAMRGGIERGETLSLNEAEIANGCRVAQPEVSAYLAERQNGNPLTVLEAILGAAMGARASDIHFEYGKEQVVRARFRLDGILTDIGTLRPETYQMLRNKLKLIAKLALTFKDIPQEGGFSFRKGERVINVRVSILPGVRGENIVLRILDPKLIVIPLEALGMRESDRLLLEKELQQPNGLILNTGPTGSGKTTTLYALLTKKKNPGVKIITIEDPVEYRIEDIEQTQVNQKEGYSFAEGLRLILRQDPDVILVGEIRDEETATTAINAALTGHLVLSTLHTNDALGAVPRLKNLKTKDDLIRSAVSIIIAQRLVRRLCSQCAAEAWVSDQEREGLERAVRLLPEAVRAEIPSPWEVRKAKGCSACFGTGYSGRVGVFEMLRVREIAAKDTRNLESVLQKETEGGMFVSLKGDALVKVLSGITSPDEAERVLGSLSV